MSTVRVLAGRVPIVTSLVHGYVAPNEHLAPSLFTAGSSDSAVHHPFVGTALRVTPDGIELSASGRQPPIAHSDPAARAIVAYIFERRVPIRNIPLDDDLNHVSENADGSISVILPRDDDDAPAVVTVVPPEWIERCRALTDPVINVALPRVYGVTYYRHAPTRSVRAFAFPLGHGTTYLSPPTVMFLAAGGLLTSTLEEGTFFYVRGSSELTLVTCGALVAFSTGVPPKLEIASVSRAAAMNAFKDAFGASSCKWWSEDPPLVIDAPSASVTGTGQATAPVVPGLTGAGWFSPTAVQESLRAARFQSLPGSAPAQTQQRGRGRGRGAGHRHRGRGGVGP